MALRYDALRVRVGGIRASDRGESGDEAGVAERQTEAGDGIVVLASVSDSRASHFHLQTCAWWQPGGQLQRLEPGASVGASPNRAASSPVAPRAVARAQPPRCIACRRCGIRCEHRFAALLPPRWRPPRAATQWRRSDR